MNMVVLTRIFHTDRNEEVAKADGARRSMKSDDDCVCTYLPSQNVSLTQHPSGFPAYVIDLHGIFGLVPMVGLEPTLHFRGKGF